MKKEISILNKPYGNYMPDDISNNVSGNAASRIFSSMSTRKVFGLYEWKLLMTDFEDGATKL